MATYNKFNSMAAAPYNKVHNFASDQLVVLLTNIAPIAGDSVTADITQIAYTNLSSRNILTISSDQIGGSYKLLLTDLVLSASGAVAPFRYVVIANSTATNGELIAWFDYGSSLTMANGETFTVDFQSVTGLLSNS